MTDFKYSILKYYELIGKENFGAFLQHYCSDLLKFKMVVNNTLFVEYLILIHTKFDKSIPLQNMILKIEINV